MATFTPPSHTEYVAPPGADRLWSRVPYQRSDAVLVTNGVATAALTVIDSDQLIAAETDGAAYHSGHTYDVTTVQEIPLVDAGHLDETIVNDTWILPWL